LIWFTSLALDCAAAVASVISGMDVLEPFDRPYLSASIRCVLHAVLLAVAVTGR
jgi:hypothetical protein